MNVTLTRGILENVIASTGYRYRWDEDGDLRIGISRKKGKDLIFFVISSAADKGILKAVCHCERYFAPDEYLQALTFCNDWNDTRLMPRATLLRPDRDGDRRIVLDSVILCSAGVTTELLKENFEFFLFTAHEFWEEADRLLD